VRAKRRAHPFTLALEKIAPDSKTSCRTVVPLSGGGGAVNRKSTHSQRFRCLLHDLQRAILELPEPLQHAVHYAVARCQPQYAPRLYADDWREELYHEAIVAAWEAYQTHDPDPRLGRLVFLTSPTTGASRVAGAGGYSTVLRSAHGTPDGRWARGAMTNWLALAGSRQRVLLRSPHFLVRLDMIPDTVV
jgi:hypothetical protein